MQQQVLAQRGDLRPVLDVGAELEQRVVIAVAEALIDAGVVAGRRRSGTPARWGRSRSRWRGSGCRRWPWWPRWSGHPSAPPRPAGRSPGLEPSRLGKLRVVWRMDSAPLAGTSPAPKQGPQNAVRMVAPLAIRSVRHAGADQLHHDGLAAGVNAERIVAAAAGVAVEDGSGLIDAVEQAAGAAGDDALVYHAACRSRSCSHRSSFTSLRPTCFWHMFLARHAGCRTGWRSAPRW